MNRKKISLERERQQVFSLWTRLTLLAVGGGFLATLGFLVLLSYLQS